MNDEPDRPQTRDKARIAILLGGEVLRDPRVSKVARTLAEQGYSVAVFCLVAASSQLPARETHASGYTIYRRKVDEHAGMLGTLRRWKQGLQQLRGGRASFSRMFTSVPRPHARTWAGGTTGLSSHRRPARPTVPREDMLPWRALRWLQAGFNVALLVRASWIIAWHARWWCADIIHANDLDMLGAGVLLRLCWRGALIYDAHELFADQSSTIRPTTRTWLIAWERLLIRHTTKVVTVGTCIATELARRYHVAMPVVVANCPPRSTLAQPVRDVPLGRPVRLVYQGIYDIERGLEELVSAMCHVRGAELYLRGYGALEPTLKRIICENGLDDVVKLLPPVAPKDLVDALREMDVGVGALQDKALNNRYCLPNKVFEYMAAGLALGLSDLPELRNIVSTYETGVVFDQSDPRAIAAQLQRFVDDPAFLQRCRQNAWNAAQTVFNWELESRKLLSVYDDLAPLSAHSDAPQNVSGEL